jgi:thiol-disulfide isomerase/thioredoxin
MKSLSLPLLGGLAIAAIIAACGGGTSAQEGGLVGQAPPAISAEGWINAEKPIALDALEGKVVLVEFWATWCPPCRKSIPHLIELDKKHRDAGLSIVSLTNEPKEKVEPFAKDMGMTYAIGYGSKSGKDYGVKYIPTAFLVVDGKIVWQGNPLGDQEALDAAIEKALKKAV